MKTITAQVLFLNEESNFTFKRVFNILHCNIRKNKNPEIARTKA